MDVSLFFPPQRVLDRLIEYERAQRVFSIFHRWQGRGDGGSRGSAGCQSVDPMVVKTIRLHRGAALPWLAESSASDVKDRVARPWKAEKETTEP